MLEVPKESYQIDIRCMNCMNVSVKTIPIAELAKDFMSRETCKHCGCLLSGEKRV